MQLRSGKVIGNPHSTRKPAVPYYGITWTMLLASVLKESQNCSGIERISVIQQIYTIIYDNKETIKGDPMYKKLITTILQKSSEHIASLNLLFSEMIQNTSYNKTRERSLDTYANCMDEIMRVRNYFE